MIFNWRRWALGVAGLVAAATMTGCVSMKPYVSANLKEVPASEFVKPNPSHPVQLLFNFQTKGVDNARVTAALKARVVDQVAASNLFDSVSDAPVAGGALLIVTVNNVALDDHEFAKGFATGLTLGLAGRWIASNGWSCGFSLDLMAADHLNDGSCDTSLITKEVRHSIYTTIGNHAPPPNAVAAATMDEAATTMLHQAVSNLLNDVSHDPSFK
jgi:hypothetical protein